MLNAGFSEKQCAAIMREILSGGEGDDEGMGVSGGGGLEDGVVERARVLTVDVLENLKEVYIYVYVCVRECMFVCVWVSWWLMWWKI